MQLQYDQILHYMNVLFSFLVFRPLPWASKGFEKSRNNHFRKIVVKINILV